MSDNWMYRIPKTGILCWVWTEGENNYSRVDIIKEYVSERTFKFVSRSEMCWPNAYPISETDVGFLTYR